VAKRLVTELGDQEILRIARTTVTESAAATYTEVALDTQLSVERGVIWLIHWIEFSFTNVGLLTEVAASGVEAIDAQVTRESKANIQNFTAADTVQGAEVSLHRSAAIGTDAGPLWFKDESPKRFDYPIPLPFAGQNIYVGIRGTDAADPHTVGCRIAYTIKEVSDKFFFRVAQALVS
jgi:hypothetical protein